MEESVPEERIEALVEQKIDQVIEEKLKSAESGKQLEGLEELVEQKVEEKIEAPLSSFDDDKSVSRRGFLKTLGLGAGGLALTSTVSAASWSTLITSSDDADSVDGYDIQKNGTDGSGVINFKT